MTKIICVHHNRDFDGYSSGAIVKRKFPDVQLIGWDYGNPVPEIPKGSKLIIIDICFPMEDMMKLADENDVTWIDHHLSQKIEFDNLIDDRKNKINYVYQLGIAACEIGWKYFFPDEEMPMAIKLLGEYDTWRNENKLYWEGYILPFQYGIRTICNSAETFPVILLESEGLDKTNELLNIGKIILDYQRKQNEYACRAAFEVDYEGLRAICLNVGGASSTIFDSVYDENKHDIMIPFTFTGKHWRVSIYTTKDIDCSVLCKKRGGGGHKQAAGFQVDTFEEIFKP